MTKSRLADISKIVSGSTPNSNIAEYWDGEIKWITPAEIKDDAYILNDSVRKITGLAVQKTGLSPFPPGTVILSSRAPIGKVAISGCEMYCNQGFKNLICSDAIYNRYLFWFLKGKTDYLNSLGRGATFKELSKQIVANIEIDLPSKELQRKIVTRFELISSIILHRQSQLSALDTLVKSQFVEMFGDLCKNTRHWKLIELSAACDVRDGTHESPKYVDSGYYLLTSKNFTSGHLDFTGAKFISEADYIQISRRSKVDQGDIIMPMIGTIGSPVIVNSSNEFAIKNVALIKFAGSKFSNIFIKAILESDYFFAYISSINRGGTQKFISLGDIRSFPIPDVPLALQNEFAAFVEQLDKSKLAIRKSLDELQLLYNSLMQEYFGGGIGMKTKSSQQQPT